MIGYINWYWEELRHHLKKKKTIKFDFESEKAESINYQKVEVPNYKVELLKKKEVFLNNLIGPEGTKIMSMTLLPWIPSTIDWETAMMTKQLFKPQT